jgi:hypothetical protein
MYRSYGQKTRRPVFLTQAAEERANRELDARLDRQDRERQELLNATIAASQAQKSPEQLAAETAEMARVGAARTADYERNQAWLDRRRAERDNAFSTMGT